MKRGAPQTTNDDTIDKSNLPYLGSCWQQIFYRTQVLSLCIIVQLTESFSHSCSKLLLFSNQKTAAYLMRCLFLALAKVVDYMHGCFIHIFRVFSLFLLND